MWSVKKTSAWHYDTPTKVYTNLLRKSSVRVAVKVREDMLHAAHALHGSVYFKVLDDAAFFAANSLIPGHFVLTAGFSLHLLRPVTGGTITATGRIVHRS
ncbi:MAG: PaaI family thioesterase, partial [Thermoleophilia bacterium]|nr:PaaI family thioesterase [Thermoleophilia bacterium]